jgi:GMP synthase-like glutamine amidotransferase
MKPVLIFQHTEVGSPGSLPSILDELGVPWRVIGIMNGEPVPTDPTEFSGLVFMGGYMSVHDTLPWIGQEIALIQSAVMAAIPVAGHCLGSQLLAKALGGAVTKNHMREIGWNDIEVGSTPLAQQWFGCEAGSTQRTFQWHGDTFEIPPGAERIASSAYCMNQAFVADGRHLGIQSHFEMTPELVKLSVARNGHQLDSEERAGNAACSPRADVLNSLPQRAATLRACLLRLYAQWIRQLAI